MITRVLVANRGEIARRVFATCRRLGVGTVAVYTDPDAASPHVAEADVRVRLEGRNGYLDVEQLLAAALASGADAIHPGYGFLSENAEFADAVQNAGLIWIGPPVAAVRAMGSKIEAKKMMAAAGVPVLEQLDPDTVTAAQLPVLIKASAGGGGRGMRVVRDLDELPKEVEAAQREAQSAFGDATVFCERYLATGHHVEVQVMADAHGTVWSVGERECSIQRRHQKIIEEAPSPLVERTPGMRAKLFEAARLAAGAIGYTGAGTVEFMADEVGDFFFLEMNTRLQVEHPVTEETTGLDLVELQLDVAAGGRLAAEPPAARGHSIEARLYAEDPAKSWQPQAGAIHRFDVPTASAEFGTLAHAGVRVDSGIVDGSVVSVFYDPMLAKVISYAPTRRQAAAILADALARTRLHGIRTNRDLLVNVLRHGAFLDGATDTAFFDTHGLATLAAPLADPSSLPLAALAAALADAAREPQQRKGVRRRAKRLAQSAIRVPDQALRRRGRRRARRQIPVRPRPPRPAGHRRRDAGVGDARPGGAGHGGRRAPVRRGPVRRRGVRRRPARTGPAHRAAPLPRPGFGGRPGFTARPDAGVGDQGRRSGRRPGHGRAAADLAGGHEDGAHHHRTRWWRAHRTQRRGGPAGRRRRRTRPGRRRVNEKERTMSFVETTEQQALRKAVAAMAANYGEKYYLEKARAGEHTTELWSEAGKLGFIGVNLPEEYGGGGAGMYELSLVMEEMATNGCALLLMVVSPAINGTIISKFGTDEQKKRWIPGIADGSITMAFAITEPDAGSNSHRITTTARRDGSDWILSGQKVYISGVDQSQAILVVGRTFKREWRRPESLRPALFVVPTDTPGLSWTKIEMEIVSPENQFQLFLDDVRLPADALVGSEDAAIAQLFAGLNPERIMGAASAVGMGRFAINKATEYVKTRQVWKTPIGAHQGISHPLAQNHIEVELAKLMMQKAATLYDLGDDGGAAEAANMAKYAAGEASVRAVDQAVQSLGGNGLTKEYGIASVLTASRLARIAPVSREMILNFVAQTSLGLPRSY